MGGLALFCSWHLALGRHLSFICWAECETLPYHQHHALLTFPLSLVWEVLIVQIRTPLCLWRLKYYTCSSPLACRCQIFSTIFTNIKKYKVRDFFRSKYVFYWLHRSHKASIKSQLKNFIQ